VSSAPSGWIERFAHARVVCVGDVMLDRYVYGVVERISPEAPIPVLEVSGEIEMLGGAGNVARNAAELGASVALFAVVGADPAGGVIERLATTTPRLRATLSRDPGRASTEKTRYIGAQQQILRADRETPAPVTAEVEAQVDAWLDAVLPDCDVVVLSDYGKGMLTAPVIESVIAAARARGRPVLVDPKGVDYRRYRGATLLSPNQREFMAATGCTDGGVAEIAAAARALIDAVQCGAVLVTRGEAGMTLVEAHGAVTHIAAEARAVFDVSGAGDTVVATLATAVAIGAPLDTAARLANAAAGIVVGKRGTATVSARELSRELRRHEADYASAKVVALDEALGRIGQWRAQGARIGFTNGCFDLVHPGHVALLRQARARCDRLIIGLNADPSVRRLKGASRPIQNEIARATVLASMQDVDLIVVFESDTPLELITALAPDVLFKGSDYSRDQVVGADVVERNGGRVELIALVPDASTTRLVQQLRD
jgi:D-beta-D-heptose 7-phosphate kinase/D-beta-D-heptose 1-phosphate adenosyltransferase